MTQPTDTFRHEHYTRLVPHPNNARRRIPRDEDFFALAASIREHGVVVAMLGVPLPDGRVMLIQGHRRRTAIEHLVEQGELPADHPHCSPPIRIEDMTAERQQELIFVGNEHRENLDPVEEGLFYRSLLDQGWPKVRLSTRLGVSYPRLNNRLEIVELEENIREMYADGRLPLLSAAHLLAIPDEDDRRRLAAMLAGRNLPLGRIETLAAQVAEHGMDALLDQARPEYSKAATTNPGRSGRAPRAIPKGQRIGLAMLQTAVVATCRACDSVPIVELPDGLEGEAANAVAGQVCDACPVRDLADACSVCPLVDFLSRLAALCPAGTAPTDSRGGGA